MRKKNIKKSKLLSKQEYIDGILSQNIVVLSKAITLIESNLRNHHELAQEIIEACIPYSGNSIRIGVTVFRAGKSTFIDTFGKHITSFNHKLAVLAIDPSSELSKGAYWAIKHVWKSCRPIAMLLYVLHRQRIPWEA